MARKKLVAGLRATTFLGMLGAGQAFNWNNTYAVISFGDSYSWVQGSEGYPGFGFMGSFLPGQLNFTAEELLSNRIWQNFSGTAEGGPNWLEFMTGCATAADGLPISPLDCEIQLWDFAFSGADATQKYTPLHHNFTIPMVNQTQQFLTYGYEALTRKACLSPSRTLITILIGLNDVSDSARYNLTAKGFSSFTQYYNDIFTAIYEESVIPLFNAGYHDFLFVNLPPLNRAPSNIGNPDPAPNITQVNWWNALVQSSADAWNAEYGPLGGNMMVYDSNTFLNYVLDNPSEFGIVNTTSYCAGYTNVTVLTDPGLFGCPTPISEYFWFNAGHMTSHTHSLLAPQVVDFLISQSS